MRVLVVEDEKRLAAGLRTGLEAEGFAVDVALDGTDGLWLARENAVRRDRARHHAAGDRTAIESARRCATKACWTPILMLTAKEGECDQVGALDTGADDYLTKPFSYAVLVARLRALIRRGAAERPAVLEAGDLRLDPASKRVWRGDAEVELTAREFALLEFLLRRQGDVVSKRRSSTTCGTTTSRAIRTSSRSTSGICATSSTGRSTAHRSRRCAAPATGSRPTAADMQLLKSVRVRTTRQPCSSSASRSSRLRSCWCATLRYTLTEEVRDAAELSADDLAELLESGTTPEALPLGDDDDTVVHIIDADGTILASGIPEDEDDTEHLLFVDQTADTDDGELTVQVGRSREDVDESVEIVTFWLVRRGSGAAARRRCHDLVVVGRALAPVEAIRAEVDAISSCRAAPAGAATAERGRDRRLATTMNRMLDRLEESQNRQRRVRLGRSHELRSPVASIRQHAEVTLAHPERFTVDGAGRRRACRGPPPAAVLSTTCCCSRVPTSTCSAALDATGRPRRPRLRGGATAARQRPR